MVHCEVDIGRVTALHATSQLFPYLDHRNIEFSLLIEFHYKYPATKLVSRFGGAVFSYHAKHWKDQILAYKDPTSPQEIPPSSSSLAPCQKAPLDEIKSHPTH